MRFLADMGISLRTVRWLREQGHDVVHLHELGLQRLPDEEILTKAREDKRILLTMDLDFSYLLALSKGVAPSIILFRLLDERAEMVNARLFQVLQHCSDELEAGAIVSVSERSIRVRVLPIP